MTVKLFVGKLSFDTTEQTLSNLFGEHGEVTSLSIIKDRETNRSRGFAFIEMSDDAAAKAAISELNGKEVDGRNILVSVAEERERKPRNQAGYQKSW